MENLMTGSDLGEVDDKLLIKCVQNIIHTDTKSTSTQCVKKEKSSFDFSATHDEHKFEPNNNTFNLPNFHMFDKSSIPPNILDDALLTMLDSALGVPPKPKLLVSIPLKIKKFSKDLNIAKQEVEQQQQQEQEQQQANSIVHDPVANWENFTELYCATCNVTCRILSPNSKEQNCAKCKDILKIRCLKCSKCYVSFRAVDKHVKYECQPRFQCSHCHYKASYQHKLDAHLKNKHLAASGFEDQDTLLKCTKCGKKYKNRSYFWKHKCII